MTVGLRRGFCLGLSSLSLSPLQSFVHINAKVQFQGDKMLVSRSTAAKVAGSTFIRATPH